MSLLFDKDYSNIVVCISFDTNTAGVFRKMNSKKICVKIDIKENFDTKHINIIRALHPTLGPLNGFINLVTHL
jgi:hypothetical protein